MATYYVNATGAASGTGSGNAFGNAMTFADFLDYMVVGGSFTAAAGDVFKIINTGTASRTTTTDTLVNGGTTTSPVTIEGVDSSGNSFEPSRTNGNGALITTNMPVLSYTTGRVNITGAAIVLKNLNIQTANSAVSVTMKDLSTTLIGCSLTNSSTNAAASCTSVLGGKVINCDLSLTGGTNGNVCVTSSTSGGQLIGCRIKGGNVKAVDVGGGAPTIAGCVIFGSAGMGIAVTSTSASPSIYGNTIVGNTGDGIDIVTGSTAYQSIFNNLITDNGGYGIDGVSAANAIVAAYNRIDRNTSGATNLATDWLAATNIGNNTTNLADTSTPGDNEYVTPGSNDYRLKTASYAKGVGLLPYADIGACQRQENYPAAADVKTGVTYGPNNESTGSYSASGGGAIVIGG